MQPVELATPLQSLTAEIGDLQPLSPIVLSVLKLTEASPLSARDLGELISGDEALAAKVLRVANSAYYGRARSVSDIRAATTLLGFREVRALAIAISMQREAELTPPFECEQFWRYSLVVGLAAELLAEVERADRGDALTAGALHNLGRLALAQYQPASLAAALELAREKRVDAHTAERRLLGFTDAELGGSLAQLWDFPPPLVAAIAHHADRYPARPNPRDLASSVVRARAFVRSQGLSDGSDDARIRDAPTEWQVPPLGKAVARAGGIDGLVARVDALVAAVGPP